MQRLEVSGAVRPIYGSLGVKRLRIKITQFWNYIDLKGRKGIIEKINYNEELISMMKSNGI